MAYSRLTRWEKRIAEYAGSIVEVEYSRGYYKCPICESLVLFTSPRDLIRHLVGHAIGSVSRTREPPSRWK